MFLNRSYYADDPDTGVAGQWRLDAAIASINLDFSRPFLPGRLCDLSSMSFLGPRERRVFNQVHGVAYARVMILVEELVLQRLRSQAYAQLGVDHDAVLGLLRLCDEEVKHQELFRAACIAFDQRAPVDSDILRGGEAATQKALGRGPLALLMLTTMLEWVVQRHYLECFRHSGHPIDPSFRALMDMHWSEESEHARLDSRELERLGRAATPAEMAATIDEFVYLCGVLDEVLVQTAEAEVQVATQHLSLYLEHDLQTHIVEALVRGFRWGFLVCGIEHPVFSRIIGDIAPFAVGRLEVLARSYRQVPG